MVKKPKSLVGPLRASDTKLKKAAKPKAEANPNAKPLVFELKCGTANQLGPAKLFATYDAMTKKAGEFFLEATPWAQRFENAAVVRIEHALDEIAALPEISRLETVHRVSCLIDSYTGLERVVVMRKIKPPPAPVQQTIIK